MGKNQTDCHSKLLWLTNNKVKRKYGIISIGSWTFVNNSSVPIESNRFSNWQAHVWVPPSIPPRSPAFIDTLSSCLRDGTQESYLRSFLLFFFQNQCSFFFFRTKFTVSGAAWCKTHSDWHTWSFFQKFVLVTFVMWAENKLFSRKCISWKQNDNLITQYEQ